MVGTEEWGTICDAGNVGRRDNSSAFGFGWSLYRDLSGVGRVSGMAASGAQQLKLFVVRDPAAPLKTNAGGCQ